jgi:D-beta-D-heptose 7-phosphate kinase/D-beta-D-heptose 1-phosphate adenosyltransferase
MRPSRAKIVPPAALARRLSRERGRGERVVFTNGCFDLLHKGHVNYLEHARRLGTRLVVALNGDASVRKLKGPGRPVNRLGDRLEVIAALECVDFVTWFDAATPLLLIRKLKPDVLVKGGDWKPSDIVGAPDVLARGGQVRSLPYVRGRSTTRILARARA